MLKLRAISKFLQNVFRETLHSTLRHEPKVCEEWSNFP